MTTRRKFIQGGLAAAVSASVPVGDGVELNSMAHPALKHIAQPPTPAFLPFVSDTDTGIFSPGAESLKFVASGRFAEIGTRVHETLENKIFELARPYDISSAMPYDDD